MRQKLLYVLVILTLLGTVSLFFPSSDNSQNFCSKISQHGITWYLNEKRPCGQFANKDWWILGPVVISRITPDYNNGRNGWTVNPEKPVNAYDNRIPRNSFIETEIPALPFKATADQSIVKSVSDVNGKCRKSDSQKHPCYLKTVAVLTILGKIPEDRGKTIFRPPYTGTAKPLYSVKKLKTDLLPSLPKVKNAPTLQWVEKEFSRVRFDHWNSWTGRYMHPVGNMPQYGSNIAISTNEAALRLMLKDPLKRKRKALISYIQAGIDYYHMMKSGVNWRANGGHMAGRKLPIVFAAILLDHPEMKQDIANAPSYTFSEDDHTYFGNNNIALFGQECGEKGYWLRELKGRGKRDCRDPYGYIDGGGSEIGAAYQTCCTAHAYKGAALAARLLPGGQDIWNHKPFFRYVDRWVDHGVWASPDPCSFKAPEQFSGQCVSGSGRFTDKHGKGADTGYYQSTFVNTMWNAYHSGLSM
ncbi:MAG: hypothetical protein ACRBBN_02610 [Methyloligellaceae bacterium]